MFAAGDVNIVVSHCKMHNDTSCDISKDGTLLTTFVPSHQGFPDDTILGVFSLCPETLGQCMFTKSFGESHKLYCARLLLKTQFCLYL